METNATKLRIGLLLGCTLFFSWWAVTHLRAADVPATTRMTSAWQHKTFDFPVADADKNLNHLASQGWEIVSVSRYDEENRNHQVSRQDGREFLFIVVAFRCHIPAAVADLTSR